MLVALSVAVSQFAISLWVAGRGDPHADWRKQVCQSRDDGALASGEQSPPGPSPVSPVDHAQSAISSGNEKLQTHQENRSHGRPSEIGNFTDVLRLVYATDGLANTTGEIRAELLEHAFSTVPYRVFWKDAESVYQGCNRNFLKDVGLPALDALVGKTDFDMPWAGIGHECQQDDRDVLESGRPKFQYEVCIAGPDGSKSWILVSKVPIRDQDQIIGVLGTYDNITSRKMAEEERDLLRIYLKDVFDSMPSVLVGVNAAGKVTQWNRAAERWTGVAGEDAKGKPLSQIMPFFGEELNAIVSASATHQTWTASRLLVRVNGADLRCDVRVCPLTDREQGCVVRIDDVTELEQKDELLRQAQKMESIGHLAGGLAHDFNNALVGIRGGLSMILSRVLRGTHDTGQLLELIELAQGSVEGASEMVERLLTLSRKQTPALAIIDLRATINNVIKICDGTLSKNIELRILLHPDPLPIHANRVQVEQALLNLCLNAADAMSLPDVDRHRARVLTVSACPVSSTDDRFLLHFPLAEPRNYLALKVQDTGIGIETAIQKRIFDPFFTTKSKSNGTGLGLAMVDGIMKQHGGAVDVASTLGMGATFTLYFPAQWGAVLPKEVTRTSTLGAGEGRILVVDDHESVRRTLKFMLEDCGYSVLSAEDGAQAIAIFRANGSSIDAVILDMTMPKCSGKDAFAALQAIAPGVRVLLMSGYDQDNELDETLAMGAKGFLKKPFTQLDLTSQLRNALA